MVEKGGRTEPIDFSPMSENRKRATKAVLR